MSRLCFSARTGPLIAVCASPSPAERLLSHYGVRYQVGLERHVVCGDSLHSEAVEKVLRRHELLKVVWRRPVERIPADDAARGVPAIKKKAKRLTEPLTPETARLVLEAAERQGNRERGLRDRAIVELMLVCALKPGELHDLDVRDVMLMDDHAVVSVPAGPNRHASLAYVPKGTTGLIRRYVGMRGAAGDEPLFATVGGRANAGRRRLARSSIGSMVAKLFEEVGVEGRAASRGSYARRWR